MFPVPRAYTRPLKLFIIIVHSRISFHGAETMPPRGGFTGIPGGDVIPLEDEINHGRGSVVEGPIDELFEASDLLGEFTGVLAFGSCVRDKGEVSVFGDAHDGKGLPFGVEEGLDGVADLGSVVFGHGCVPIKSPL